MILSLAALVAVILKNEFFSKYGIDRELQNLNILCNEILTLLHAIITGFENINDNYR